MTFTKKQEQKKITIYFSPSYSGSSNIAPGVLTMADINFGLLPVDGSNNHYGSGRYPVISLSTRPSLSVPAGKYYVYFNCRNVCIRKPGETGEGQVYSVKSVETYQETITINEDSEFEVINVSISLSK